MKKLTLIISFFVIALNLSAENGLPEEANTNTKAIDSEMMINKPIVIRDVVNHAMIEKFNNAEYSSDQLSFSDLVDSYSFQEVKQLTQAYRSGEVEALSDASVSKYLRGTNKDNWLHLYGESDMPVNSK